MNKKIIAILVAGLIIFIWQFLSWALLNLHSAEYGYTPSQDRILQVLQESDLEEGTYFLPFVPPGTSAEDQEAFMMANDGKPWAQINYHPVWELNMGMNLIRGILVDLVAAFLLVWILLRFAELDFMTALVASLAVGAIGYIAFPYTNSIWFETDTLADLLDTGVQWGLVGAWLGYYLPGRVK